MQSLVGGLYCNAHRHTLINVPADQQNRTASVIDLLRDTLADSSAGEPLLCYGIGSEDQSIQQMQAALMDHLFNLISANADEQGPVLLVGPSMAHLQNRLGQSACMVESQADFSSALSAMSETGEKYQLIVVEGSVRFADQLHLLTAARASLQAEGMLLLCGEYLDDDSAIKRSPLANLSSLRQLSERLGFQLDSEEQLSSSALQSLRKFIALVAESRNRLLECKIFSLGQLDDLEAELENMAEEFTVGRRSFNIFLFSKLADPPGEYAHAEYNDIHSFLPEEIKDLFEASFGVDFDPELWHWKYSLGHGTCVVARERPGKAIVSHYGGAPRKIDYFGASQMAIQPCDVMVLPEVRRQYGKNSLFFKTAATFLEREIGNTVDHLLGFGFPNQKAMNIALRLGLYEKTDDFIEIIYPANTSVSSEAKLVEADIDSEEHQQQIDRLWHAMRGGFSDGIIGVRDADYMRYRYFDHPFARRGQYQRLFLIPEGVAEPAAMAVLKEHDQHLLLMDLVCPLAYMPDALALLSAHSNSETLQKPLKLWLTRGWQGSVETDGCTVNELGIEIPCNSWNPGPSSTVLYGAWWLTAGDMDFM